MCDTVLQYVFLICCFLYSINGQGPSVDDLVKVQESCPNDRPYICVKYGKCCSGDEFCHAGICESCFPAGRPESELLVWCRDRGQHDLTLMRHGSCRLACHFRFNASDLSQPMENVQSPWMVLFIVTFVLLVCGCVGVTIYICVRKKFTAQMRTARVRSHKAEKTVEGRKGQKTETAGLLNENEDTPALPPVNRDMMRSLSNESNQNTMLLKVFSSRENVLENSDIQVNVNIEEHVTPTEQVNENIEEQVTPTEQVNENIEEQVTPIEQVNVNIEEQVTPQEQINVNE